MASSFLYQRLTKGGVGSSGTLAEPEGTPEPRFALQSTVNWMQALAMLAKDEGISWQTMQAYYKTVQPAKLSPAATNTVFEQLLLGLHHLSALSAMSKARHVSDFARVGIMGWYYGIYCAASAMIAAQTGAQQDSHNGTANEWDRQIAEAGLAAKPFHFRLNTLVKKDAEVEIARLRNGNTFVVNNRPSTIADATGACVSYLSGTRNYREWQITEDLKKKELRKLNFTDFRSNAAKQIRDERLRSKTVGFLHQAFRYRGKANYRDALFLTHGPEALLSDFIPNMEFVLRSFLVMAGAYCSRRVSKTDWQAFMDDLEGNLKLSVMPKDVWS